LCKSKKLSLPNKNNKAQLLRCKESKLFNQANTHIIKHSFHKQERLCSKKQMEVLFGKGRSSTAYPVKLVYNETATALIFPAQAMFVAPKRSFKRAHDRNKLKRRMREAYRLNKQPFYERLKTHEKKLLLAFIYIGKKQEDYLLIEKAILKLISGLSGEAKK
jgi:ribonuclease P protein component